MFQSQSQAEASTANSVKNFREGASPDPLFSQQSFNLGLHNTQQPQILIPNINYQAIAARGQPIAQTPQATQNQIFDPISGSKNYQFNQLMPIINLDQQQFSQQNASSVQVNTLPGIIPTSFNLPSQHAYQAMNQHYLNVHNLEQLRASVNNPNFGHGVNRYPLYQQVVFGGQPQYQQQQTNAYLIPNSSIPIGGGPCIQPSLLQNTNSISNTVPLYNYSKILPNGTQQAYVPILVPVELAITLQQMASASQPTHPQGQCSNSLGVIFQQPLDVKPSTNSPKIKPNSNQNQLQFINYDMQERIEQQGLQKNVESQYCQSVSSSKSLNNQAAIFEQNSQNSSQNQSAKSQQTLQNQNITDQQNHNQVQSHYFPMDQIQRRASNSDVQIFKITKESCNYAARAKALAKDQINDQDINIDHCDQQCILQTSGDRSRQENKRQAQNYQFQSPKKLYDSQQSNFNMKKHDYEPAQEKLSHIPQIQIKGGKSISNQQDVVQMNQNLSSNAAICENQIIEEKVSNQQQPTIKDNPLLLQNQIPEKVAIYKSKYTIEQSGQSLFSIPKGLKEEYEKMKPDIMDRVRNRFRVPVSVRLHLRSGYEIDMTMFQGRMHVPLSRNYTQIKFFNQETSRRQCVFSCDEDNFQCKKIFRKWHNLFDHLRIHTHERPFHCPVTECKYTFNQISNQKKHLDIHGSENLQCKECGQHFNKQIIINHFEHQHNQKIARSFKSKQYH